MTIAARGPITTPAIQALLDEPPPSLLPGGAMVCVAAPVSDTVFEAVLVDPVLVDPVLEAVNSELVLALPVDETSNIVKLSTTARGAVRNAVQFFLPQPTYTNGVRSFSFWATRAVRHTGSAPEHVAVC